MNIELTLQDKQEVAFLSPANEILYGGAAGGGKSHLMRVCAIYWCLRVANFQAYFFRRHYEDLIKNHMGGPNGFRMMLAPLVECGDVTIVEKEIRFNRNGSKIFLCHCNDEDDVYQYWGAEIHAFFPDELTHFTEQMYRFLRGRCRAVGLVVPEDLKGKFPCIMAGSNPGNIGHQWVKSMFIDPAEPYEVWRVPKEEGGTLRQFIPATLEDNPKLMEEDPEYESKLLGLGSEEYVKAIRWGSWDVLEGAFFTEFDRRKHVIPAFSVPKQWKRFRSFDWGFAKPFCVHWWAIADGETVIADDGTAVKIPRNALVCYREWYGCSKPNVGLRMTPELIAAGVKQREKGESFSYSVADPSIFKQDGGPSIGERLASYGVVFRGGDNSRVSGWSEVRARMSAVDGPMIYFFQSCVHTIRTIPIMQYDDVRQEDLDTDHEDHAVDSCFPAGTLINTPSGQKAIERFSVGDLVETREGNREVSAVFSLGEKEIWRLKTSDGSELLATANHPVWVEGEGFTPLSSIRYGSMIRTCTPINTADWLEESGKSISEIFREGLRSTILTEMFKTTKSRIFKVLKQASIGDCISRHVGNLRDALYAVPNFRQAGLIETVFVRISARAPIGAELGQITLKEHAATAERGFSQTSIKLKNSAQISAHLREATLENKELPSVITAEQSSRQNIILRLGVQTVVENAPTGRIEKIFNLTVDQTPEYFANGVLVSNCRYACMSRPFLSKQKKKKTAQKMTLDELVKFNKEWKRREFRKKANFY